MSASGCDLCRGVDFSVVLSGTDHREGLGGRFSVVRCRTCGLARTDPIPDDLDAWYPATYAQHAGKDSVTVRAVANSIRCATTTRSRHVARIIATLVPDADLGGPIAPGALVLDVGAGIGTAVAALRRAGVDAYGLEPSETAVASAHARGITTVLHGTLDHVLGNPDDKVLAPVRERRWDVIRLYQVLEHVRSPVSTLRQVRTLLSDRGRLVVGVPNFDGFCRRAFGPSWDGLELPRHLHHFTSETLGDCVAEAGLRVESTRSVALFGTLPATLDAWSTGGARQRGFGQVVPIRAATYPLEVGLAERGRGEGLVLSARAA